MSASASAAEVEAALEGLEPTGDLTVSRSENDDNGYDWQVWPACLHVSGKSVRIYVPEIVTWGKYLLLSYSSTNGEQNRRLLEKKITRQLRRRKKNYQIVVATVIRGKTILAGHL